MTHLSYPRCTVSDVLLGALCTLLSMIHIDVKHAKEVQSVPRSMMSAFCT